MSNDRDTLERELERLSPSRIPFDQLARRRDRKRRNQRIAAGVVGIAVFVAAVWIVTSGLSLDRSENPVAPAGEVTGSTQIGPAETAPPSAPASAAPDGVRQRMCSDGARWQLELTDIGDRIKVRFEVHRSPVGHRWRIHFWNMRVECCSPTGPVFFRGTRVASDSGIFVVQLRYPDTVGVMGVKAKALDTQTGQVCNGVVFGP